ncbi:TIM-barrel domain-containing protein [Agriterribacter humi]|uniref:TIM-barrel domain-containing protein n=1 Tax=Agriterribacter humi TaxID=1104781 RepID=UPI001D033A51|nr:TIM-barrel domain-containing protein [Agriterribacter humi]
MTTARIKLRMNFLPFAVLALILLFCSCTQHTTFIRQGDGITVEIKDPAPGSAKWVRLQAVSPKIIRVTASNDNKFTAGKSLMIDSTFHVAAEWSAEQTDKEALVKTSELVASVSFTTGEVIFKDKNGNIILQEKTGGGKKITPVIIDDKPLYRISQQFESPAGEAFYGLGQPQTGQINYKDEDVDLTQYNSIVAVPFLLSNRNYGLLWDNYSITHFGDNREKQQLSALQLTGKGGTSEGLTATYSDRTDSTHIYMQRQEDKIDYSFLPSLKNIPAGFPMEKGKVTWEGFITADTTGEHKFYLSASGYLKFWLDGKLLLDKWREGWNPGPSQFRYMLSKGQKHAIKVEWIPESTQAFASLQWLSPTPPALHNKMTLSSEAAENIDYYFICGANADEVIGGYRQLTGKATLLPQWALGFWQSRERYKTEQEIENVVAEFRKRKIGLDNIVLDWSYWKEDAWGSQQFDRARFPDAAGMIGRLHERYNTRFMISVWPKFYEGIENYKIFDKQNWLYKQNIKDQQRDWIGKGYISTFYDAFNPTARMGFWKLLDSSLFIKGVDAWWLDATEPDILSNATIEKRKQLMQPTASGSSTQYFNGYPLQNAKGIYEGQRSSRPNQRVFILTRSAYAGMQRYAAATWSGDIAARFDEMERQIPAGINFSLSGLPYWTNDIGGFFVEDKYDKPHPNGNALEEWRELNTRWYQFGAFCPLFRSHGQYPYREIFNIAPDDHPAYKSMLYYNQLRYRLMPYIYSVAGNTCHNNYTMMRGLIMDFGTDANVKNIGDQYMFGPSFLVNPVYTYKATFRPVYLPAGQGWYNLYTGEYTTGGQHITAVASYERMPVFVKEGSIIPFGPQIEFTGEKPADDITLYVYTGKDGSFTLYEDEGVNYNYEKGKYSNIPITYNEANKTLTIGKREGDFKDMLKNRLFRIVWVTKSKSTALDFSSPSDTAIAYNGNEQTVTMNGKF